MQRSGADNRLHRVPVALVVLGQSRMPAWDVGPVPANDGTRGKFRRHQQNTITIGSHKGELYIWRSGLTAWREMERRAA